MYHISERFLDAIGPPSPAAPPGLRFDSTHHSFWETLHAEIGSGWYLDGFLYLFGDGLEPLLSCITSWSFLVPPLERPMVVGYNAFGTLLVLKDRADVNSRIGVLDPARVVWWDTGILDFEGMIGAWLPENRIPHFLDHSAYDAWRARGGRRLGVGEMLSMKTPAALGGAFEPDNFEISDIVLYYRVSGPVYEKTLTRRSGPSRSKSRGSHRPKPRKGR